MFTQVHIREHAVELVVKFPQKDPFAFRKITLPGGHLQARYNYLRFASTPPYCVCNVSFFHPPNSLLQGWPVYTRRERDVSERSKCGKHIRCVHTCLLSEKLRIKNYGFFEHETNTQILHQVQQLRTCNTTVNRNNLK